MRLLNVNTLEFADFLNDTPKYVIASHRWGPDEAYLRDVQLRQNNEKRGFVKIRTFACCIREWLPNIDWLWIDTCCIDLKSSQEVTEAVNSMFRWYADAEMCLAYLEDVASATDLTEFCRSMWFTRGWTLQELLAPPVVVFLTRKWEIIGQCGQSERIENWIGPRGQSLEAHIAATTGIPEHVLRHYVTIHSLSPEQRLSWIGARQTTREEDMSYSLLGILDVSMPILYGEGGEKARRRLLEEISKTSPTTSARPPTANLVELRRVSSGSESPLTRPSTSNPSSPGDHPISRPEIDDDVTLLDLGSPKSQPSREFTRKSFEYSKLSKSGFRVFVLEPGTIGDEIRGQMSEHNLLEPLPYYSLSYTWGPEPPIHHVFINNEIKPVQPNLFQALQRIRQRDGQIFLWIDSLCIDQSNLIERKDQVSQMAAIYGKASGVFIWLGEEDFTSKFALAFIDEIVAGKFVWDDSWMNQYGLIALAQLLERTWFRRGWVLQEAAFSQNSIIHCGDRQVHMDHFTQAIELIQAQFKRLKSSFSGTTNIAHAATMANFQDSPAIRLLDTIEDVFKKSAIGDVIQKNMSLETLVDLNTFSETTDRRDAIYSLLSMANDIASPSPHDDLEIQDMIIPDYNKEVLEVFVDFVMHCCQQSGSLDIICRPWAPVVSSAAYIFTRDKLLPLVSPPYPSWIASKASLPFGDPATRSTHRLHGNPFVGRGQKRLYNAHYGSAPQVSVGRFPDGKCNGTLSARGFLLGVVAQRSTRMVNATITRECLSLLGTITRRSRSSAIDIPDTIWRTVCADHDENGRPAQRLNRMAMQNLLQINANVPPNVDSADLLDYMSPIDIEELLESDLADHVKGFLTVVRDVVWNRRTFQTEVTSSGGDPFVGLIPQSSAVGDWICILYGCSAPVVLRRLPDLSGYKLIGDAYVHGVMDGEPIRLTPPDFFKSSEYVFEIC